jgi:DNA-binding beta-propeller fold protein YncE
MKHGGGFPALSFVGIFYSVCSLNRRNICKMKYNALAVLLAVLAATTPSPAHALIKTGENANDLLGQFQSTTVDTSPNWTQNTINNANGSVNALGMNDPPEGIALDPVHHYLFVADSTNNRVMVYVLNTDNSIPTASGGHSATYILGQTSLTASAAATSQTGLRGPIGLDIDTADNLLFVADAGNNRVLTFSTASISTGMAASNELGQPTGTAFTSKAVATTSTGMHDPEDVAYDAVNHRLFVADNTNNRVLVFSIPSGITNGMAATDVLGQTSFTTSSSATAQDGFHNPDGLAYDSTYDRLFVGEYGNLRVTVFTNTSTSIGVPPADNTATYVLGEPNFTTSTAKDTQAGMGTVSGVSFDHNNSRLFVADTSNDRVLVFDVRPAYIRNGMNASYVLGEPSFTSDVSGTTQATLNSCHFVHYDAGSGRVFVSDSSNSRVMIFDGSAMGLWPPGYE